MSRFATLPLQPPPLPFLPTIHTLDQGGERGCIAITAAVFSSARTTSLADRPSRGHTANPAQEGHDTL